MVSSSQLLNSSLIEVLLAIILAWDAEGKVQPAYSKLARKVLGNDKDISGCDIDDILCDGSGDLKNINSILFGQDSDIDFESLIDLAPKELCVLSTTYKLIYEPIFEKENITAVVVYGRDITQEKIAVEKREKEMWQNAMLLEIIKDRGLFQTFYSESIKSLHKATRIISSKNMDRDSIDVLFRVVHSIKGSGASFKIRTLMKEAHELEH